MWGNRDVTRETLMGMDDRDLFNVCHTNQEFYYNVCNEDFFRKRLLQKYPQTLQYKPQTFQKGDTREKMTYKEWYLQVAYYIAKLKEDYKYDYTTGDPSIQYKIFKYYPPQYRFEKSIEYGQLELVKYFLENENENPQIGLMIASKTNNLEMFKFFVEKTGRIDDTSLEIAIKKGNLEIIKYMIESGKIPNRIGYVLRMSSLNGNLDVVRYLIKRGKSLEQFDIDDSLDIAIINGHLNVVKHLVNHGADIHKYADLPLIKAIRSGHFEIVRYLVESGATIVTGDEFHERLLKYTFEEADPKIVKYLKKRGLINGQPSNDLGSSLDRRTMVKTKLSRQKKSFMGN